MKEQEYKIAMNNLLARLQRESAKELLRKQIQLIDLADEELCLDVIYLRAKWN